MKKLISAVLAFSMLALCTMIPAAAEKDQKSDTVRYEKKKVTTYLFDEDDPAELSCLFRSDLPEIPYISVEDYLNQLLTEKVSVKHNGDVYTFTNGGYDMVVDAAKDAVHFDRAEDFCSMNAKPILTGEEAEYLETQDELTLVGELNAADLDLGKYGIDITASDGKVYLPYCTLNDIFANNYRLVQYAGGELRFWESMDEDLISASYNEIPKKRSQALIDFTYNEFCFTIDYTYGRPSNAEIAESIGEKGLDKTLDEFNSTTAAAKKLLLSESSTDFVVGLIFLDTYFADGGHTTLSGGYQMSIMDGNDLDAENAILDLIASGANIDYQKFLASQTELLETELRTETIKSARDAAFKDMDLVKSWDCASTYENGDTVIFSFDEFKDAVVEPFKWSLDYADEHHAKRFIIDLSANSGGATSVSEYMMSIVCGDNGPEDLNILSGNRYKPDSRVDKNLDGKFDEEDDKVKYDFEYAVLTTAASFSCANLLPCFAQDNGICIVGEKSSGGTCNVTVHLFPDGALYTTSGSSKILRSDGSDNDKGAIPDAELSGEDDNYSGFFDIEKINAAIDSFYENKTEIATESETADETAPQNAAQDSASSDSGSSGMWLIFLWVGLIVAAVVILLIFIVVIIRHEKKKKDINR